MKLALAMVSSLEWFSSRILARKPIKFEHIKRTERILAKLIHFSDRFFNVQSFAKFEQSKHYNPLHALNRSFDISRAFQFLAKDTKLLDEVFKVSRAAHRSLAPLLS
jgi:hypothetical protein